MKNRISNKIGLIIAIVIWIQIGCTPNLDSIKHHNAYLESEISYKESYTDLVVKDESSDRNFLLGQAENSIIYSHSFPFNSRKLDKKETSELLTILNDSSTYAWGEFGTPECSRTIIYLNSEGEEIGYTKWDPLGEVDSYPYRSLMKWGGLTKSGERKLRRIIEKEG